MNAQFWLEVKAPCCSEMCLRSRAAYWCSKHGTFMTHQTAVFYGWARKSYEVSSLLEMPRSEIAAPDETPIVRQDLPPAFIAKKPSWLQTLLDLMF